MTQMIHIADGPEQPTRRDVACNVSTNNAAISIRSFPTIIKKPTHEKYFTRTGGVAIRHAWIQIIRDEAGTTNTT
jgi:hypothetical protein